jgi:serine/threonine protein kinase
MLLTGRPPFGGSNEDEVFDNIEAGKVPFTSPVWQQVGGSARSFVQHLLMVNPERRYTAAQALKSPWLSEFFEKERRKSNSSKLVNDIGFNSSQLYVLSIHQTDKAGS